MSTIRIVCTGTKRAAHRELLIAKLSRIHGLWCETQYDPTGAPGDSFYTTLDQLAQADGRYPLSCRRCPKRNTRVTPATLTKALDALDQAGFDCLDLLRSPF